ELNSVMGLARRFCTGQMDDILGRIQNDLFDLGADLATPENDAEKRKDGELRITASQVTRLESEIDAINADLNPLTSFILPGGSELSAWLHLARTVARRAERHMTELAVEESVNEHAMRFINRVSDLLFVLARAANDKGKADILWVPGGNI
ncbi:cob(I)yrinic acid a,c-diamide adenosyltransferase, partial [Alphaproteobacteria bacterium]|nr:cob(I)yrinic acid a,c-diamide adenosyltransferase [Alphaproteobacteria bacterium]